VQRRLDRRAITDTGRIRHLSTAKNKAHCIAVSNRARRNNACGSFQQSTAVYGACPGDHSIHLVSDPRLALLPAFSLMVGKTAGASLVMAADNWKVAKICMPRTMLRGAIPLEAYATIHCIAGATLDQLLISEIADAVARRYGALKS